MLTLSDVTLNVKCLVNKEVNMYTEMETTIELWSGGRMFDVDSGSYLEDCVSSIQWAKDSTNVSITIWF